MRKIALAVIVLLALAGCSGVNYVLQEYGSVQRIEWRDSGGTGFRIYDKPSESKMMITPSLGAAFVQGATFGASRSIGQVYEDAANEWLAAQGRQSCKAIRTVNILDPQHEVEYRCA